MFTPILRAIGQLDDPALLAVLVQTVLLSALCFAGLGAGALWFLHHVVAHGALGWLAGTLGLVLALLASVWLFVPIAMVIAGLFLEPVCRAVERRWYPGLPPAHPAGLVAQGWDGAVLALQLLGLSCLGLILSLIAPGIGNALGAAATAWALGRGLFAAVAMRRTSRGAALAAYHDKRWQVLLLGAALTLLSMVPLLNLLLPILGPATMVHLSARGTGDE